MKSQFSKTIVTTAGLMALAALVGGAALAGEVPVGTVLNKANLAAMEKETFQGMPIGKLLTDSQKMWIKDYNLKMKLGKPTELKVDPAYQAATKKYAGQATLDPAKKTVGNYKAGIPFTNVDLKDPDAGYKLAWNQYYANPVMGDNWIALGDVTITESKKGVIDHFEAISAKLAMEGRTTGGAPLVGNAGDHAQYLLVLTKPFDLAGLGIYTKQYSNGNIDDAWAYVKSIRRTRRVAGGKSWMDPQPKMDLLNDDNQAVNCYPLMYKGWKFVEKRWILAVVNAPNPNVRHAVFKDNIEQSAPYWNPSNAVWEPREVYVLEATMPPEHPYSKKVLYQDVKYPMYLQGDLYDRKGSLWRLWRQTYSQFTAKNGKPGIALYSTQAIDFQRTRATYIDMAHTQLNNPEFNDKAFTPEMLSLAGSGGLDKYMK